MNFDLLTTFSRSGGGGLWENYLLPCCCIRDSLSFGGMQHDRVLEKLHFDLLTPSPGSGEVRGMHQNINYHVAEFVILFNLICSEKVES